MQMADEELQSWAFIFPCQERPQAQGLQAARVLLDHSSLDSGRSPAEIAVLLRAAGMYVLPPAHSLLISWKGCSLKETSSYHGCFSLSLASLVFSELQLC